MNTAKWLENSVNILERASIHTARLDCLVLLEDAIRKNRAWLLAHPDFEIANATMKKLQKQVVRRSKHEPLAYIRGKSEFYGREFQITPETLQPRPETETMLELLKTLELPENPTIVDIGTGSGAIAISAKLEHPQAMIHATEIQEDALKVAKENAKHLSADVTFHRGNLLMPLSDLNIDVLLCNLPYVPDSHTINEAAMQEPRIAIFGGEDGLELYRHLFMQIETRKHKPCFILTESLPFQHETLAKVAKNYGYALKQAEDFIQVFTKQ